MRILGIDCGAERTGYAVVETDGREHRVVTYGVIRTKAKQPAAERLREIAEGIQGLIEQHAPEAAAIETVFHAVNARTAIQLAQVRGAVLVTVAKARMEIAEYSPLEVKRSVTGYGRAEKGQVQRMVSVLLGLGETPAEDAADALAVAVCHAHRQGVAGMRRTV